MTDAERATWLQLVNDQPASAFSATHIPMLMAYVRNVVRADILHEQLQLFDPQWLEDDKGLMRYKALVDMAEKVDRIASMLATRLRITRQALEEPDTAGAKRTKQARFEPWKKQQDESAGN